MSSQLPKTFATALAALLLLAGLGGCKSRKPVQTEPAVVAEQPFDTNAVVRKLAADYKNGQLTRCVIDDAIVYFGAKNAPDAGAEVFDIRGRKIGACYYSTNRVDPICEKMYDCSDLYRVSPNIWGLEAVELKLGE